MGNRGTFLGVTMNKCYDTEDVDLYTGDVIEVLETLEPESVQCAVTSPPYWGLRSYMPDKVKLKESTPSWVKEKLKEKRIKPIE